MKVVLRNPPLPLLMLGIMSDIPVSKILSDGVRPQIETPSAPQATLSSSPNLAGSVKLEKKPAVRSVQRQPSPLMWRRLAERKAKAG